jgi:hypothetical protein
MSTSPDPRPDDRLVTVLSQWLARHADDEELRRAVEEVSPDELSPLQAEAVGELRAELDQGPEGRGELEMIVRETLEAVALG